MEKVFCFLAVLFGSKKGMAKMYYRLSDEEKITLTMPVSFLDIIL